jgi:Immunity protein 42
MIIGASSFFAIESGITQAYERLSLRALGFFVIHVGGRRYGVYSSDATMLANSFDEVNGRIARRGQHTAPFATDPDAGKIADDFRLALYADDQEHELFFGIPKPKFSELIYSKNIMWAPDGDEAFDDGSYVLQFDVIDRVRLIAFRLNEDGLHEQATLSDVWLPADDFYRILQKWLDAFETEWTAMPKVSETKHGPNAGGGQL